jgi:phytoene dehydrogenase-like protein
VLVLEQHFRVGGYTHTFSRPGGFRWDVGIHYVGEVADRGLIGDVCRSLTDGELAWARMEDPFDRLVFPGFEFAIRSGRSRFAEDLVAAFPAEAKGIRRWLRDLDRASRFMAVLASRSLAPAPARWAMSAALSQAGRLAATTTRVHLEATCATRS